ncbi:MAG: energy transducer TonB, partial [Candidatus Eremiobacteraeota bacterium]|nr:energy transducer TonB [Candidatus Eremiobacteraeota bacterium]
MYERTRITPAVLGVLAAALIGFTVQLPANAATHVFYSNLSPVAMAAETTIPNSGSCPDPDSNAGITSPYPAQWLKLIAAQTGSSSTQVMIDLDSVGNVLGSRIAKSSGNTFLDEQALVAANGSKY